MRTVTYGAACSLDGFIAATDGRLDWLHFSRDVQQVMTDYWKTTDAVLMGRKTWEIAAAQGGSGGSPGVRGYVFSRTLKEIANPDTELVSENAGEFVRTLKQQKGKGICVLGGGDLAKSLFDAGVIDEVGLNVHPIILGGGVPFFAPLQQRVKLKLMESRTIDGGCVLSTYRGARGRKK